VLFISSSAFLTQHCSGDHIEKNDIGGECSTYGRDGRGVYRALVGIQDLDLSDESDCPPSEAIQTDHILISLVSTLKMEEISSSETLTFIHMAIGCDSTHCHDILLILATLAK
jgi:hypothetical protein